MKYKSLFFISLTVLAIVVALFVSTQEKNSSQTELQANFKHSKTPDEFSPILLATKNMTVNQVHSGENFNCDNEISELKRENQHLRDSIHQLQYAKNLTQELKSNVAELDPDPALEEINKYKAYLLSEERDIEWVNYIQPTLEKISDSPEFEGVSIIASECRSTICQMDLYAENSVQSDSVETTLLTSLSEKFVGITLRKFEEPAGGVRIYVFMTKNGASLQHMVN